MRNEHRTEEQALKIMVIEFRNYGVENIALPFEAGIEMA
jgi:hypothetical protein